MTVILAALHDNGRGAIIVSDMMRTTSYGESKDQMKTFSVENEDIKKIFTINKHVTVAAAGDVEFWSNVIDKLKMEVNQSDKCNKVIKKFEIIYRNELHDWLALRVLFPHYNTFEDYRNDLQNLAKKSPYVIENFERNLLKAREHIPSEFLLIGKDDNKSYKIYSVSQFAKLDLKIRGHDVIGGGHKYAFEPITKQLLVSQNKEEVLNILKNAKKLAEVDEEVGEQTVIKFLSIS